MSCFQRSKSLFDSVFQMHSSSFLAQLQHNLLSWEVILMFWYTHQKSISKIYITRYLACFSSKTGLSMWRKSSLQSLYWRLKTERQDCKQISVSIERMATKVSSALFQCKLAFLSLDRFTLSWKSFWKREQTLIKQEMEVSVVLCF